MPAELSDRYAPILHLAKGERFFPMAVEDLLSYAALYRRDEDQPLAAPGRLRAAHLLQVVAEDTYLRTLTAAPQTGADVVRGWNAETQQLLVAWARSTALSTAAAPVTGYDEGRAQRLYRWYAAKTQPATRLFWWNDLLMARTFSLRRRGAAAEPLRLSLPAAARDEAVQRYEAAARSGSGYTYYYRLVRQGDYAVLQYWYLYAYQDWATAFDGLSDHEGDWESVQLFFRLEGEQPVEPPVYIAYLGHGSRLVKPWLHRDVGLSGTHPHVYVAAGSHAAYPERKVYELVRLYGLVDRATGDGLTLKPNDWRSCGDLDEAPFVTNYPGTWGTPYCLTLAAGEQAEAALAEPAWVLPLPGVSAPYGPRFAAPGS